MKTMLYAGTYTAKSSQGIYSFSFEDGRLSSSQLFCEIKNPKYLTKKDNCLITVADFDYESGVALINAEGDIKNKIAFEKRTSCFITSEDDDIYTANYHTGVVTHLKLVQDELKFINSIQIQDGAGCHQILVFHERILVPCLFLDRVFIFDRSLKKIGSIHFNANTGPRHGNKLLVAGNGGSAADSEHIVGELMKGFVQQRKPDDSFRKRLQEEDEELGSVLADSLQGALPAIALDGHPALSTAYMNDCEPLLCFAQQVNGYGKSGDVFLGISTSGNSKNILYAAVTAHAKGMRVIGLTGQKDSKLSDRADICIQVPQTETYMIQELHLPVYHCLCLMLEERFFSII